MGAQSKIEWTNATWNPIRGCSRVSAGCAHCYAERMATRFSKPGEPYDGLITDNRWNGNLILAEEHLEDPLRWKKPRRVFVNSMSDLFHEHISDQMIDRVFAVMARASHHTFQVLTKRPSRMLEYLTRHDRIENAESKSWRPKKRTTRPRIRRQLPNVWLGVSVEDQQTADERIPLLTRTPAIVRFVSYEPALGPMDLFRCGGLNTIIRAMKYENDTGHPSAPWLDWVIAGGESGPGARPMHPDWARSIRDQCQAAAVPFFFKQHGEFISSYDAGARSDEIDRWNRTFGEAWTRSGKYTFPDGKQVARVGKKAAGRLLDDQEWSEFPVVYP